LIRLSIPARGRPRICAASGYVSVAGLLLSVSLLGELHDPGGVSVVDELEVLVAERSAPRALHDPGKMVTDLAGGDAPGADD
jgi:hypothetical protein